MQAGRGFLLFWFGKPSPRKGLIEKHISKKQEQYINNQLYTIYEKTVPEVNLSQKKRHYSKVAGSL